MSAGHGSQSPADLPHDPPATPDEAPLADPVPAAERAGATPSLLPPPSQRIPVRALFSRSEFIVAGAMVVGGALAGCLMALMWWLIAPRFPAVGSRQGLLFVEEQPEEFIASDAKFGVLAVLAGVAFGLVAWLVLRRWRGPVVAVSLGLSALAASWVSWHLGEEIGKHLNHATADHARLGETVHLVALQLGAKGVVLVQPLIAVIVYAICASWAPQPGLRPRPALAEADETTLAPSPLPAPLADSAQDSESESPSAAPK